MERIFDSGDEFESYFDTTGPSESESATFNADIGGVNTPQSHRFDHASHVLVFSTFLAPRTRVLTLHLDDDFGHGLFIRKWLFLPTVQ